MAQQQHAIYHERDTTFISIFDHRWAWGRQLGGGSAKFWPGGEWFLDPQWGGGASYDFQRGGIKLKKRKNYFTAAEGGQNFAVFNKKKFFWRPAS